MDMEYFTKRESMGLGLSASRIARERGVMHQKHGGREEMILYIFFGSRKHQSSNRIYEMTSLREFGITARVNGRYRSNRDFDRACVVLLCLLFVCWD